jgi:hypothetical protein
MIFCLSVWFCLIEQTFCQTGRMLFFLAKYYFIPCILHSFLLHPFTDAHLVDCEKCFKKQLIQGFTFLYKNIFKLSQ